ncbi:MAG: riboflavin synthase [Eubacterium sp.]|nr:riboflavin synthase [Eubacterium sp.]SEG06197.1 riboflavin synthase alpha chain [Eubacterium ruminantium]
MFTGLIEEVGRIKSIIHGQASAILYIKASKIMDDVHIGDSIAVNGVCLTATSVNPDGFTADVMAETLRRSNLGDLGSGSQVNLERAMAANGRFGGHIVSGHIDGTGVIRSFQKEDNAIWVTISCKSEILRLIVEKGSITIDGISLTVAYVDDEVFKVSIIPHTASETTLITKKAGDKVNLENDVVGKYVEKLLTHSDSSKEHSGSKIDNDFLARNGFF